MSYDMNNTKENAKNSEFLLTYVPAKHDGIENWRGTEFTYHVSVSGNIFHNREERNPVGFYGTDLSEGKGLRRFRWDRISEIISLTE
jgi:hypothetical protein